MAVTTRASAAGRASPRLMGLRRGPRHGLGAGLLNLTRQLLSRVFGVAQLAGLAPARFGVDPVLDAGVPALREPEGELPSS